MVQVHKFHTIFTCSKCQHAKDAKDAIAIEMDVRLKFSLESISKQALVHIAIAFNMLENYYLRPIKTCYSGLVWACPKSKYFKFEQVYKEDC